MSDDRTVHAETDHAEVVRYERAGKWVVEGKRENFRTRMTLWEAAEYCEYQQEAAEYCEYQQEAAEYCEYQQEAAVTVHWGRPGGRQFNRRMRESNSPAIANPWSAS